MSPSLKEIISKLPDLTADELSVVIAAASQLKVVKAGTARPSLTRNVRPNNSIGAQRKKGPAKLSSEFVGIPEYQRYKTADKALKALLKANRMSLKQARASETWQNNSVIKEFEGAQSAWFRKKASFKSPMLSKTARSVTPPAKPEL